MKKAITLFVSIMFTLGFSAVALAGKPASCQTIPGGSLYNSEGDLIQPGFDQWGYNYQAHKFMGDYCDAYHGASWCSAYAGTKLAMKWNDAWLANKDCDGDGSLDRHAGYPSYIGSGAWLTNNESGTYEDSSGNQCSYVYFVKIVAAPADATETGGVWYSADGNEIGPDIWGQFAVLQEVYNDSCGSHGVLTLSPVGPGFGKY